MRTMMSPGLRNAALTVHVTASVGLLGAIAAFLALAIAGIASVDDGIVRAAYRMMPLLAWSVVVPLSLAALLTGIVQSLGTAWGLFRHYWVVAKLGLTAFATIVLLLKLRLIGAVAAAAAATSLGGGDLRAQRLELVAHAAGGIVVLLVPVALSITKPRGRTGFARQP